MGPLRMMVGLALVLSAAGCAAGEKTDASAGAVMPAVVGQRLDVALSDIERAGVKDEVEVVGGGTFGVIDESNWLVCEQLPAAGEAVTSAPRLTVDRECGDGAAESTAPPETVPSNDEPVETVAPEVTTASSVSTSTQPAVEEVLTAANNADLAALLSGPGECSDSVAQFAAQYAGRTIEFDGNVAYMAPHGDASTRFDFLIYVGDYSETDLIGPSFRFTDEGYAELHLTGDNIPDSITQGTNLHIVATVGEFTTGCLLLLEPVSTSAR